MGGYYTRTNQGERELWGCAALGLWVVIGAAAIASLLHWLGWL